MNVVLLVPRRADGGRRDHLWRFCRDWWTAAFPAWKIVEGHHDAGPFNRAAAVNRAAELAGPWDIAVVCDADVLADPQQVEAAVHEAERTGRATLAYHRYVALSEDMTNRVLDGYDGSWERPRQPQMTSHCSSLVAVPRPLWAVVGGFDERFVGWGAEDLAFAQACRVLGGGVDHVSGTVFHLSHPVSPERSKRSPLLRAGQALANRYCDAVEPDAMRRLIAERDEPDGVLLLVLTDGRRECIADTIPAAEAELGGLPIVRRLICDDSADSDYQAWLRLRFPAFELVCGSRRRGFAGATRAAWAAALASGQRWIFWLEDDFVIERPVDLRAMAGVLTADPTLLQMALRRQAWFPPEVEAGGVIEQHPDAYTDRSDGTDQWLEHALFWTNNPHLVARQVLADHEWPTKPNSEALFARQALTGGCRSGYWGARDDPPLVRHIGHDRIGTGY